ncbi:MAG: hypothetical protein SPF17_09935 [Candidatus Mucispirillum faecigallinarum]|nr:hypothetical protein [Candidatus Mucispirillum faecigallinarum]
MKNKNFGDKMNTINNNEVNKEDIISLLDGEQVQVSINIVKVEMPVTPVMWSMSMLVKQAGFSKSYILDDIRKGVLIRDKHYVMKGSHYLFIRDEVIPYIKNKFKLSHN